jgi:Na+/H+-dicarboxylate symporter
MHAALRRYLAIPLGTRLLVAFGLGAAAGWALGPRAAVLAPLGHLLAFALRVIAPPVVAVYIVHSLSDAGLRHLGRHGPRLLGLFTALSVAGAGLGMASALITRRWLADAALPGLAPPALASSPLRTPGWLLTSLNADVVLMIAVLLAVPLALVVAALRHRGEDHWASLVHRAAGRAAAMLGAAIRGLMEYAPFGVFALAAVTFSGGSAAVAGLSLALASVYIAHLALGSLLVALVGIVRGHAFEFLVSSREALMTALVTGSSAATVPVELRTADVQLHVPPSVAGIAIGVGATLCKVGTTAFLGALVVWAATLTGTPMSPGWLANALALATMAGMLTPPISGGGYVMLGFVVGQFGLAPAVVPLLVGVPFIGKLNTPLNALGRLACASLAAPPGPFVEAGRTPVGHAQADR